MNTRINRILLALACVTIGGGIYGCATLKSLPGAIADLQRLQFKLDNVSNFRLSGIDVSRIASRGDIGFADAARLTSNILQKQLPAEFTLNVAVKNPNDGGSGRPATNLFLRKIAWTLYIDDRSTISGVTDQRLQIPGSGQTVTIPLTMQLDLYKFFSDRGADDLINLGLAIGGSQGSSSRLKLTARITAEVPPFNAFEYPGEITIVDKGFSNP